jgi:hypothetical protein
VNFKSPRQGADAPFGMPFLFQHRLAAALIGAAVAATVGVFMFTLPQYNSHRPGLQKYVAPAYVVRAEHGWTWPNGLPGFRLGLDESRWNFARIRQADLATLRRAAPAAGVDPQSLRVLDAARVTGRSKPYLLVAGGDARGRTCLGAQAGPAPIQFFCAKQLEGHVAVVIAAPQPYYPRLGWAIHISGVVSADVTAVTLMTAGVMWKDMSSGKPVLRSQGPRILLQNGDQTFGTFASFIGQPVPWNARLDFYGAHGKKLRSLPLRFHGPGAYVYVR